MEIELADAVAALRDELLEAPRAPRRATICAAEKWVKKDRLNPVARIASSAPRSGGLGSAGGTGRLSLEVTFMVNQRFLVIMEGCGRVVSHSLRQPGV